MKTMKLIVGIISIVLFTLVSLQSCVAGVGDALADNGSASGFAGIVLAICLLIGGIVGIAAGRSSKGGTITAAVFYAIGGLVGVTNVGTYSDLAIWAALSFIFAGLFIASLFIKPKQEDSGDIDTPAI